MVTVFSIIAASKILELLIKFPQFQYGIVNKFAPSSIVFWLYSGNAQQVSWHRCQPPYCGFSQSLQVNAGRVPRKRSQLLLTGPLHHTQSFQPFW